MLRPAGLLALPRELLCHRASTLGSLHQLPVSYKATWLLPRPDLHRLVVPSLARRARLKKPPASIANGSFRNYDRECYLRFVIRPEPPTLVFGGELFFGGAIFVVPDLALESL